jgi:signal transduction histidine kinase
MISNAAEAIQTRGKGSLRVAAHRSDTGSITVEFADDGVGIPENNLPRLFEPFFTTKKKGKGVGLGLSVAYGIVQEHGGQIEVSSAEGEGTQVRIELPLAPPSAADESRHGGARDTD